MVGRKKPSIFSDSMCSREFLPLSSFHEMFVDSCWQKKNLGSHWVLCFSPNSWHKCNCALFMCTIYVYIWLSVKVPSLHKYFNQIWWEAVAVSAWELPQPEERLQPFLMNYYVSGKSTSEFGWKLKTCVLAAHPAACQEQGGRHVLKHLPCCLQAPPRSSNNGLE